MGEGATSLEGVGYPPSRKNKALAPTGGEGTGEGATSLEGEAPAEPKDKALCPCGGEGRGEGAINGMIPPPAPPLARGERLKPSADKPM
jgi:hypothetical protein